MWGKIKQKPKKIEKNTHFSLEPPLGCSNNPIYQKTKSKWLDLEPGNPVCTGRILAGSTRICHYQGDSETRHSTPAIPFFNKIHYW